ncbi:MAG: ABC transporter permease [Chloroflexota bacterium]
MVKFLTRRIFFLIVTLFLVSIAIFAISEIAPGNIAVNTLGNTITEAQEQSFNAQNGLDQPILTRYRRWLIGSDWRAEQLIGKDLVRVLDEDNGRYSWWIQDADGTLYQTGTEDAETIIKYVRQPDGSVVEQLYEGDPWKPNEEGIPIFWGIDRTDHAVMWVRGANTEQWVLTKATWTSAAGAPQAYIPLQRGLLRGDPGKSFKDRRPVAEVLPRRLINTFFLAVIAFVFIMPISLVLGLMAGLNEGGRVDRSFSTASLVATATPPFATGVFLILIFSTWLNWFPGAVVIRPGNSIFSRPSMLILPVLTLTLVELGYVLRITRSSMVEVMRTNYIRTAILKGMPRRRVIFTHALKNALMAPITIIMLHVNWLVGGIVVVEVIFGFPGVGSYVLEAALFKDVFAVEAAAMILVIIAVGTQLLADIIYTYLNPRIRYA